MSFKNKIISITVFFLVFSFFSASFVEAANINQRPSKTTKRQQIAQDRSLIHDFLGKYFGEKNAAWRNCFNTAFESNAKAHSIANSYLLMYSSLFVYDKVLNTPTFEGFKKRFRAIVKILGINNLDFINKCEGTADTQAVVMSTEKAVIVVFRGSEGRMKDKSIIRVIYDWIFTDLNFFHRPFEMFGEKARVHTGFYNGVDIVYDELKALIEKHIKGNAFTFGKPKSLWLTGHSLGGGLAPIAAARLIADGITVNGVYTYGAPRFANPNLAKHMGKMLANYQRWVLDNDIVTKVPFKKWGFQHSANPNNIYEDGQIKINDGEMIGTAKPSSHYPTQYLSRIYEALPKNIKGKMPPAPPHEIWSTDADDLFLKELEKLSKKFGES